LALAPARRASHGCRKIIEFHKKEMPGRGWQPNMNLRSGGSKAGKTLLVAVGNQDGKINLTLTVGGMRR
jgi:hypothetical protein